MRGTGTRLEIDRCAPWQSIPSKSHVDDSEPIAAEISLNVLGSHQVE